MAEGAEKWRALFPRLDKLPGERWLLLEFVREDEPRPGFDTETALSNTGSTQDGSFKIPPILSGGDA